MSKTTGTASAPRGIGLAWAIAGVAVVIGLVVAGLAARPLDLTRVGAQRQPFVARMRTGPAPGCGLNEAPKGDGCERVATTFDAVSVRFPSRHPERGLHELAGTLTVPRGLRGPRPGVLLIGGSGPTDRDGVTRGNLVVRHAAFPLLKNLAELLSRQGMVVLRYDKRSCGRCYPEATGAMAGFRFQHLVDDAEDAVALLRGRGEVDGTRIVIAGHSQGGQLAPFLAAGDRSVVAVMLLAATTQTMERGLTGQLERLAELRLAQYDLFGAYAARTERDRYQRCFDRLRHAFDPDEMCIGGGISQQALAEGEAMSRQTLAKIRGLQVPVLAIAGNLDRNIDPAVAITLRDALTRRDGEVHYLGGVGHSLTKADKPDRPRLAPGADAAMADFLRSIRSRETSVGRP